MRCVGGQGRHVVIVDDLVQSGGTLIECQKLLTAQVGWEMTSGLRASAPAEGRALLRQGCHFVLSYPLLLCRAPHT